MRRVTIRGRDGRTRVVEVPVGANLADVVQDGEALLVGMAFMDASGTPDGVPDADVTDADLQRVEDARNEMIARTRDRWKGGRERVIPVADATKADTPEIAFAAYKHRLTNAWRRAR